MVAERNKRSSVWRKEISIVQFQQRRKFSGEHWVKIVFGVWRK